MTSPTETLREDRGACGAKNVHGEPCQLAQGWGVPDRNHGPCRYHTPELLDLSSETLSEKAKKRGNHQIQQTLKDQFLEALWEHRGVVEQAAAEVGRQASTIWRWRKEDPKFDGLVDDLRKYMTKHRLADVEDNLYQRARKGGASPAEVIFFLCNRGGQEGWKDVKKIEHDVEHSGGVMVVPGAPGSYDDWEEAAREQQAKLEERTKGRTIEADSEEDAA